MKNLVIFLIALVPAISRAEQVLCYDRLNAVMASAPKGWVVDVDTGRSFGLCAMFYLEGHDYHDSPAVVYPRLMKFTRKDQKGELDLPAFIYRDLEPFYRKSLEKAKIKEPDDVIAKPSKLKFSVRRLLDGPAPNEFEAIGYLPMKDAVLLLVLTARNDEDFAKFEPRLKAFMNRIQPFPREKVFELQKGKAKKDQTQPEGSKYEAAFLRLTSLKLTRSVRNCLPEKKDEKLEAVNAVFEISKKGLINDWLMEKEDQISECVRKAMLGTLGPAPPFYPFHIFLELKVK